MWSQSTNATLRTVHLIFDLPTSSAEHFLGQTERLSERHFSQCIPRARLVHIVLWFYVRSDLTNSAAVSLQLSFLSGGQAPFTLLRDFETSLAADAWKAGDLGLTRRRMARVLKGLPHEQERRGSGVQWRGGRPRWHAKPFLLPVSTTHKSPNVLTPWWLRGPAWPSMGTNWERLVIWALRVITYNWRKRVCEGDYRVLCDWLNVKQ